MSFIAIFMVLVIHSAMPQASHFVTFDFFQHFFGDYINRLYLVLFMCISGFLFFQNITVATKDVWIKKYKSRFNSLLVPYIVWNILFILQMAILQYNPITSPWINEGISPFISSGSILQSVWMIFTLTANLPLWFVRNLMIIVVFTPIIYYSIKSNFYIIFLIILFLLSLFHQFFFTMLFFYIGSLLAIRKINIEYRIKTYGFWILLFLSVIIGTLLTLKGPITNLNFYLAIIPLLALWFGYDYLHDKGINFVFLEKILPYTFFIYVYHMPALNIFKKLLVLVGGKSEFGYFFAYLLSPVLMVLLAYLVGSLLKKIMPKTYSVLVGSRK